MLPMLRVVHQVCGVGLPLGPHGGGAGFQRVLVAGVKARIAALAGAPSGERVAGTVETVLADGDRVSRAAGGVGRTACGVRVAVAVDDAGRVRLPDGVQVVACRLHRVLADTVLAFAVCGAGTVLGSVPTNERVSVAGETIGVCGQLVTGLAGLYSRVAAGRAVAVIGKGLRGTGPAGVQGAGTLQRPLVARVDGLALASGLGVPRDEHVSVAGEPVVADVDLLVGLARLRVGLTAGRAVAVVGEAGLAGRPLRVQGQSAVRDPRG
ncbi:hypothetical protein HMPREF1233_0145, partial [Streptococcus pyogenes GA19700]